MDSYSLPTSKLIRVAAFEIRAANQDQYNALLHAYSSILTSSDPIIIPGGLSFENGDKELRIIKDSTADANNRVIIYWEVDGNADKDIKSLYRKLDRKSDYTGVIEPHTDGKLTNSKGDSTESCILRDEGENQFGLIINPPYPRSKDNGGYGSGIFGDDAVPISTIIGLIGLGLFVGLLVGWLLARRRQPTASRS